MLKKILFLKKKNDIWLYKMGTVFFLVKFIIFIFLKIWQTIRY